MTLNFLYSVIIIYHIASHYIFLFYFNIWYFGIAIFNLRYSMLVVFLLLHTVHVLPPSVQCRKRWRQE